MAAEAIGSLRADLPDDLRAALAELADPPLEARNPLAQLDAIFGASSPYVFQAGVLSVQTDPRWFSTQPAGGSGSAILELRRWPGDTVLALYSVAGAPGQGRPGGPPLADAELELAHAAEDGSVAEWVGTLQTEAGPRPVIWSEVAVEGSESYLGSLLLPGDAGLGSAGLTELIVELRFTLGRVRFVPEAWKRLRGIPPGEKIRIPLLGGTPGDKSEDEEPWQVVRASGFTVGLPPGFRAHGMDGGVPAPRELPGGLLWFRGRFQDLEGSRVVVGDRVRFGYVARVDDVGEDWAAGKRAPLGAPGATRKRSEPFPLITERTGAGEATAARWTEEGFTGDWLVFRLRFGEVGLEIGMPVLEGRRSASLYWIPATLRDATQPPAPPPVDPAERFGIRFERLRPSEQSGQPWTEGYLTAPGFRAEIPKGWFPSASLRSSDGYPIRLVDSGGTVRVILSRKDSGESRATPAGEDWSALERPGRHRAVKAFAGPDGALLLEAQEGHAFVLEPGDLSGPDDRERWRRLVASTQLVRLPKQGKKDD